MIKRLWYRILIFLDIKAHDWELVLSGPTKLHVSAGYYSYTASATAKLFRCRLSNKEMAYVEHDGVKYSIPVKKFYRRKPRVIPPHKK